MRTTKVLFFSLALIAVLAMALTVIPATPVSAIAACASVHTTDLASWNLSETRSQGHNELEEGGLHIWTESNTSQDKAAGYYTFSAPLSTISSASMVYNASFGASPGLQIVIDGDKNGPPDGILVGETVYGANWWLSNASAQFLKDGAPHTGGGNGSNWFGTLTEWATAFPNAQVVAIGYSLGSGAYGDGILVSMTYGCNVFTFGLPGSVSPILPPGAGFACRVMVDSAMPEPLYAQWLNGQAWMDWDGFVVQDLDKHGGIELSLHNHDGEYNTYQFYRVVGNNGGVVRTFERTQGGVCVEITDPLAEAS
jgi:hypothetical protein